MLLLSLLFSRDEYNNASDHIKEICIKAIGMEYYYTLGNVVNKCTGCGLCIKTFPGKRGNKALMNVVLLNLIEKIICNYLSDNLTDKNIGPITVKVSQLKRANLNNVSSRCWETAYIKLLTQLFGDILMIANTTGCSSIYGCSVSNLPYSIHWASCLFEDNAKYRYIMLLSTNIILNMLKQLCNTIWIIWIMKFLKNGLIIMIIMKKLKEFMIHLHIIRRIKRLYYKP